MSASSEMSDLVALEPHGPDVYVGESPGYEGFLRVYGGLVVAQALRAAAHTVADEFSPHSLHGYFIRAGTDREPIRYEVDRIRNGRSFITRRVVARQSGGAIFNLSTSFHIAEDGTDVTNVSMPSTADPDDIEESTWSGAYERREISAADGHYMAWVRPVGAPETAIGAACALAYASDDFPMDAVRISHPEFHSETVFRDKFMGASLDHSIWFHRALPHNEWMLFDLRSRSLSGSRGLATGEVYSADGTHLASLAQEVLMRELRQ